MLAVTTRRPGELAVRAGADDRLDSAGQQHVTISRGANHLLSSFLIHPRRTTQNPYGIDSTCVKARVA